MLMHIYMRGLSTFSGCGWAYGFHTHTITTTDASPDLEWWLKSHTVTTIDASQDVERVAKILPDARLQTMPID
jgi:hypothetical protein